nr:uncharacterized protein LOC109170987 [Ipomoea batatas]GMD63606.1 uncharacterized protein LOC109170987 [Ipomoea batatas]GMD63607.1 uncharacterized protein LOC109170987 [Ipomoea batatas]
MSCDGRSAAELRRCSGSAVRQCGLQRRSDGRAPAGAACSDGAAGCFATELRAGTSSRQRACSGGGALCRWVVDGGGGVRRRWSWATAVELGDGSGQGPKYARRRRSFLFEDNGCKDTVLESWNSTLGDCLTNRLNICGTALRRWESDFAKRTQRDIDNIQRHLNSLRDIQDVTGLAEFLRLDGQLRGLHDKLNIY